MTVTYTFSVRQAGVFTSALVPIFTSFKALDGSIVVSETIVEIADGYYKFDIDWDASKYIGIDSVFFIIDATATILSDVDRYLGGRVDRADAVDNIILQTAVTAIGTTTTDILTAIAGTWKIIGNQLIMYETDGITIFRTFNLLDADSQPASTQVFTRQFVS